MSSKCDDTPSKSLKFGVDRLLASDDKSPRGVEERCSDFVRCDYQTVVEDEMTPILPGHLRTSCTECVSSIFRCCPRVGQHHHAYHPHQFFSAPSIPTTFLHTPKPIRAYPNLIMERDDRVTLGKRKRSWSRAVFSNLQRKGLEKRFQLQKYITKPDRRQLAATLGLTDAQVKVWFQNRRMKWRHTKEMKHHVESTVSSTGKVQKGSHLQVLLSSGPVQTESMEDSHRTALLPQETS